MKVTHLKKTCTLAVLGLLISGAMVLTGCGGSATQKAKDAATDAAEAVTDAAAEVKDAVEDAAEEAAADVKDAVEDVAEDAKDAVEEAQNAVEGAAEEVKDAAEGVVADAEEAVEDALDAGPEGEESAPEGESAEGESDSAEGGDSAAEGGDGESAEGESEGGGPGESGSSEGEAVEAPEMEGEPVYKFLLEKQVSTSLGGMEDFTAYVLLLDAENENGNNALIGVCQGSSVSYTEATWSEDEDGTIKMPIDEFTIYSTKDIDGVKTFVNIRYNAGMMSNGVVDIPMVDLDTPIPSFGSEEAEETEGDAAPAGEEAASEGGESEGDAAPEGESEGEAPAEGESAEGESPEGESAEGESPEGGAEAPAN